MRAEVDHAGRIVLTADTGAESTYLRSLFAGQGTPHVGERWELSHFHNDGTIPVRASFFLVPAATPLRHETGGGEPKKTDVDTNARRFAERAVAMYEERVLGRRIVTAQETLQALLYMFSPDGRPLTEKAWSAPRWEDG